MLRSMRFNSKNLKNLFLTNQSPTKPNHHSSTITMQSLIRQGRRQLAFSVERSPSWRMAILKQTTPFSRSISSKPANNEASSKSDKSEKQKPLEFRHDYSVLPDTYSYTTEMNEENFQRFPMVTAKKLARRKDRPRNVRMLTRDFIDGRCNYKETTLN